MQVAAATDRATESAGAWEHAALIARVQRRYLTMQQIVQLAGLTIELLRVANPDLVLARSVAEEETRGAQDASIQPYWAEAWDSAVVAGRLLAERDMSGLQVLDLGCGLGLAGVAAAARGAQVMLADAVSSALLFARANAWPWRERVQLRWLDWRHDQLPQRFELIVGADILYQNADWPYLETFWRRHLAAAGRLLLTEPGRMGADKFVPWLTARGWHVHCSCSPRAGRRPVRIWQAHTKAAGDA